MHPTRPALLLLALTSACARVDATVELVNGATPSTPAAEAARAALAPPPDGRWALTPSLMTVRLRGVTFVPAGGGFPSRTDFEDCTGTYDRSQGSLASMGTCDASIAVGTYGSVEVAYETTFEMVVDDAEAGIWSDPSAPGGLVGSPPDGGAQPIEALDPNTDPDDAQVEFHFVEPLVVGEGDAPVVSVLFDPTHWMKTEVVGGAFTAPLAGGNPPLLPAIDGFGKAAYYTSGIPAGSYRIGECSDGACMSLLFLYADDDRPTSVTWQDNSLCPAVGGGWTPVASFAGNTMEWGAFGRLGRDGDGVLAWVSAEYPVGGGGMITGFTGVYRMPEADTPGDTVDLDYRCSGEVPEPSSGDTFASGAPAFTPDDTVAFTLRY